MIHEDLSDAGGELINIEPGGDRIHVIFIDGTLYKADALIGCDEINSITREIPRPRPSKIGQ